MTLVLGIGASSRAEVEELDELVTRALAQQGFSLEDVTMVASADVKREVLEPWCRAHGWALKTHTAQRLSRQPVPTPGARAQAAIGTASVAEAAALQHGDLLTTKTVSRHATVAIARLR